MSQCSLPETSFHYGILWFQTCATAGEFALRLNQLSCIHHRLRISTQLPMSRSTILDKRVHSRLPLPRQFTQTETKPTSSETPQGQQNMFSSSSSTWPGTPRSSSHQSPSFKTSTIVSGTQKGPATPRTLASSVSDTVSPLSPCPQHKRPSLVITPRPYTSTTRHTRARSEQVEVQSLVTGQQPRRVDPSTLQADFNELRCCFGEIAFTVAKQEAELQAVKEELRILRSERASD